MRIISGKFKGSKLFIPLDKNTRPLKDMVKESIFNTLIHSKKFLFDFENTNILDLFSGTGSFGLECISRGSTNTIFVENNKDALTILNKNINKLKIKNKTLIIEKSVFDFLTNSLNIKKKFDLIFLDPPFSEIKIINLLNIIYDGNILSKNGIIIMHRHKKSKEIDVSLYKNKIKKLYGLSKIIYLF